MAGCSDVRFPARYLAREEHHADISGISDQWREPRFIVSACEAEDDSQALESARRFVDGCDVEVWHLDRKIGRLERVNKR
jgi:hypothetical protein